MKLRGQNKRIYDMLKRGTWVCTGDMRIQAFVGDPPRRILDLKELGFEFDEPRTCQQHKNHTGNPKEWRLKTSPIKEYPKNIYFGQTYFEVQNYQEEEKVRAYQAQKETVVNY